MELNMKGALAIPLILIKRMVTTMMHIKDNEENCNDYDDGDEDEEDDEQHEDDAR